MQNYIHSYSVTTTQELQGKLLPFKNLLLIFKARCNAWADKYIKGENLFTILKKTDMQDWARSPKYDTTVVIRFASEYQEQKQGWYQPQDQRITKLGQSLNYLYSLRCPIWHLGKQRMLQEEQDSQQSHEKTQQSKDKWAGPLMD